MGCTGSKVENEEGITRCRGRKRAVKRAVRSRNAYARAHADYLEALKTVGVAFRQFTDGEFRDQQSSTPTTPTTPMQPAEDSPVTVVRTVSLPSMALKSKPPTPITVVVSPPRSPKSKQEAYQEYLYNDAPPREYYSGYIPQTRSSSSTSPPAPPMPSYSYSYPSPSSPPSWDFFGIFQPAPVMMHLQEEHNGVEEVKDELYDVMEKEGIPALEVDSSPPRKQQQQKHQHQEQQEPQQRKKKEKEIEEVLTDEGDQVHEIFVAKGKEEKNEKQKEVMEEDVRDIASSSGTTSDEKAEEVTEEKKSKASLQEESPVSVKKDLEIWEVLRIIEEQFSRASVGGSDVARMLEARKAHYHSGMSERSARILRAVSRTQWSPKTPLSWREASEDSSSEQEGSFSGVSRSGGHATTLDRLYAWEKKLYIEVKGIESVNIEFRRKVKLLAKQDARGASYEIIDKTRAAIKQLETQMQVSIQAMNATSQAIQKLTDEDMFPQLLELLEGSMIMWKNMSQCHHKQKSAVMQMKVPGNPPMEATSNSHRQATKQLEVALNAWHTAFTALIATQREYMHNLNSWLRLSLYTPDRAGQISKGKSTSTSASTSTSTSSSTLVGRPPIHRLCQEWIASVDRLPEANVVITIKVFAEAVHNVVRQQEEEARSQRRAEHSAKELNKKILSLNNMEKKYVAEVAGGSTDSTGVTGTGGEDPIKERREIVNEFRKKVEKDKEEFTRAIQETRSTTVKMLEGGLPKLLEPTSAFALLCYQTYQELQGKVRSGELDAGG